ncbi:MAG: sigma 54-interacting transcriptional regulator [Gemmatimonadetes bacterium]|nr:sigma 54-interacting transcriptional regulator [Gemmatimonadota bacterium]
MTAGHADTLGALKESGYRPRRVKDEIRANLVRKLETGEPLFSGIRGYEDSVTPQLVNALLARHDFILLGLRGQAKSRILRQLVELLDEAIPVIRGSEVNDDPLAPISMYGRLQVEEHGDETPVDWVGREQRYLEKLATPDVTIADIIGDLDPIKAARGGHILSDELTIHYGMLPRANRGIFAMNELPDLSPRIQVGLFNILQEGDIQIKGYPVRLSLDLLMAFTANPEDYTARGKIITPLKDRIGAEIQTHYPKEVTTGVAITEQEAWTNRDGRPVEIPDFISELIERVAFLARREKRVDQRSGVSQRMPISVTETVVSSAEQRAIRLDEPAVVPRVGDVYAALPAITGKMELEYEGELQGADRIARELISAAAGATYEERAGGAETDAIVEYFEGGGVMQVSEDAAAAACVQGFGQVPGLMELIERVGLAPRSGSDGLRAAACELVLEALVAEKRISRTRGGGYRRAPYEAAPDQGQYPIDPFEA